MTAVEEDRENTWKRQVGTEDWGEENMEARFRKFLENGNGRRNVHRLTRVSLVTAYCSERVFFIRPSPTRTQSARPCLHGWSFNLRPAKKNGQTGSDQVRPVKKNAAIGRTISARAVHRAEADVSRGSFTQWNAVQSNLQLSKMAEAEEKKRVH